MGPKDEDEDPLRLVTAEDLIALGADPDDVERLPTRHVTAGGEPCWPLRDALDTLEMIEREGDRP